MIERPILFSAPMVRAILAGQKTQTRRVACRGMIPAPYIEAKEYEPGHWRLFDAPDPRASRAQYTMPACPFGQLGDQLVVRETWRYADWTEEGEPHIEYAADGARRLVEDFPEAWASRLMDTWTALSAPSNFDIDGRAADRRWRPSIHMPRWASRITLEIAGVRVERLQAISEADSRSEGCTGGHGSIPGYAYNATPGEQFIALWKSIYGAASWDANPWMWVIDFKHLEAEARDHG